MIIKIGTAGTLFGGSTSLFLTGISLAGTDTDWDAYLGYAATSFSVVGSTATLSGSNIVTIERAVAELDTTKAYVQSLSSEEVARMSALLDGKEESLADLVNVSEQIGHKTRVLSQGKKSHM